MTIIITFTLILLSSCSHTEVKTSNSKYVDTDEGLKRAEKAAELYDPASSPRSWVGDVKELKHSGFKGLDNQIQEYCITNEKIPTVEQIKDQISSYLKSDYLHEQWLFDEGMKLALNIEYIESDFECRGTMDIALPKDQFHKAIKIPINKKYKW